MIDDVGRRIAELRRRRGWAQAQLAEELNLPTQNVARLEQGGHSANLSTLVAVARALDEDVAALFEEPASRAPRKPGRPPAARSAPATPKKGASTRTTKR